MLSLLIFLLTVGLAFYMFCFCLAAVGIRGTLGVIVMLVFLYLITH